MKPVYKRLLIHFVIILAIIAALIVLSQMWLKNFTRHGQGLAVPDFVGMTVAQAQKVAKANSLQLEVIDSLFLPNQTRGTVFRQTPESGGTVKKNRRILVTINSVLPRKVSAPSLVGFSLRQAKAELISQNFQLGTLYYEDDFATNIVLEQMHKSAALLPGTPIDAHSTIDLVLGVDPYQNIAYIPRVVGLSYEIAKDILTDHYLNVGTVRFEASVRTAADSLAAVVVRQEPEASNSYPRQMGTQVHITLSLEELP